MELNRAIESTRLGADITGNVVEDLVAEALALDVAGVCVSGFHLPRVAAALESGRVCPVAVANFPHGDAHPEAVISEIGTLASHGAREIDVVAPLALARAGKWLDYVAFLQAVGESVRKAGVRWKVILESAALSEQQLERAAVAAVEAGADWLKTSTGFHAAGGASVEAVRLLRDVAPETVGVKASGGIRTADDAHAMIEAGADRLGTSSAHAILGA